MSTTDPFAMTMETSGPLAQALRRTWLPSCRTSSRSAR